MIEETILTAKERKKIADKKYYEKNKEKIAEYQRNYRKENPEKIAEYREKNAEQIAIGQKVRNDKWAAENKDRKKELDKVGHLKRKYNLDVEEYDRMLVEQNYSCKICETHISNLTKVLCVDHCHATGKVRGLLCHSCNVAIGLLKDNTETLKKAIKYLEET